MKKPLESPLVKGDKVKYAWPDKLWLSDQGMPRALDIHKIYLVDHVVYDKVVLAQEEGSLIEVDINEIKRIG